MEKKANLKEKAKEIKEIASKDNNVLIIAVFVVIIIGILMFVNFVLNVFNLNIDKKSDIKAVRKVLSTKFNDVKCVDSTCKYVIATIGDETAKTVYEVYDLNGRRVVSYAVNYKKENIGKVNIIGATNNYFVTRVQEGKRYSYVLRNTNGKEKYISKERINILSDKLAVIKDNDKNIIVNKNGKILIDNVDSYNSYVDGKVNQLVKKNVKLIINEKGDTILKNYSISEDVKKDDKTKYLIVQNTKNDKYYYFSVKSLKIIGDSFDEFDYDDNAQVIISKKENKELVKYLLKDNGNTEKYTKDATLAYNSIAKKIDSENYYLYRYGINDINQKIVFVNNKKDNSFGTYNVKNKKYSKMFDYKTSSSMSGALVYEIYDNVLRITCSKYYCEHNQNIIYDISKNKKIYEDENDDVTISEFTMYDNNYKVVKYSYSSSNRDYAGKSYLYDKNNKVIKKDINHIAVIDKNVRFGSNKNSSLLLYSTKAKKFVNNDKTLASKVTLADKDFYRYKDSKSYINIYNSKGDKIIRIPSDSYITYTNSYVIYLEKNVVKMFNAKNNRTRKYVLKNGDKLNDETGEISSPYRGVFFVNNTTNKVVKVVNAKGRNLKKIRNVELSSIDRNTDGSVLIFVKKFNKNTDLYGLYVAK